MESISIETFQPCYQARCIELFILGEVLQFSKDERIQAEAKKFIAWSVENDLSNIDAVYLTPQSHGLCGNFWIAKDEKQHGFVCGMVGLERKSADEAELRRMFVDSQYQGNHVGSKLIETAKAFAVKEKIKSIFLTTPKGVRAVDFYLKHGFYIDGEMDVGENDVIRLLKLRCILDTER